MWATAASYGVGLLASAMLGRRALPLPIPWLTLGQVAAASLVMAAAVAVVPAWGGLVELIAKAAVGGVVYGLSALAMDAAGARGRLAEAAHMLRTRIARPGAVA
ncbi:polysaccharide biosynthesis C-terminal domain-containing protein, partial [Mycobacterium tuberculosis]